MDENFFRELVEEIVDRNISTIEEVDALRRKMCRKHHPKTFPSYIQILTHAKKDEYRKLKFLQSKPTRTISGVAPLAIMARPMACPHGKCTFCPGGLNSFFGNIPQSYTGREPATMRAVRNNYDPYLQVFNRLEQYLLLNQNLDKIELIIMGGTFPAAELEYQKEFVKYALKAMNDFGELFYRHGFDFMKFKQFFELPASVADKEREKSVQKKILGLKGQCSLEKEKKRNETSFVRCIAMALETRPDCCRENEIDNMLGLGCTRVELGVQSICNNILKKSERGHTVEDSIEATRLMKDSFLKVGYHLMPGMEHSTKDKDISMMKEIFSNPDFRPDFLKIYPCMVMPGTKLHERFKEDEFKPLSTKEAAGIIAEGKRYIPHYCRVQRVQRDIPTNATISGVDVTNLRQYIELQMQKKGIECSCIRCREPRKKKVFEPRLKRLDYDASGGREIFLSFEDRNRTLIGFLRMRKPHMPFRKEITESSMGIREIHVYSPSQQIGTKGKYSQHRGFGIKLMEEAEKIAVEEFDARKMLVIAGIGVREYFRKKLKYRDDGIYVSKAF